MSSKEENKGNLWMKVPAYRYGYQPASVPRLGVRPSPQALREEVRELTQTVDDVLAKR